MTKLRGPLLILGRPLTSTGHLQTTGNVGLLKKEEVQVRAQG